MTSFASRNTLRHAVLLGLAAAASIAAPGGAIMALTPAAGPNVEGRWVEAAAAREKQGVQRIGMIDIASCGDDMCVVQVSAAGECGALLGRFGPPQLQPTKAGGKFNAYYKGTLQWRGRNDKAAISLSREGLWLTAFPDALAASLSRSVIASYYGNFARSGGASCSAPVS